MKFVRLFLVYALVLILFVSACGVAGERSQELLGETELTVNIDNVTVTVLNKLLRNSVQTYYLMSYPEPHYIYLEVILSIQGLDDSPASILEWGAENIMLSCEGTDAELSFHRREIADEIVEYKVGEQINFYYIFIYSVLRDADFETCVLAFSDGQNLIISPDIGINNHIASPSQLEEKGAVLSGEDNRTYGENAVVAGGSQNSANAVHSTVSGGNLNAATTSHATVGGGRENIAIDFYATVGGGYGNTASARDTFVGGGSRNMASGSRSTIGGGIQNQATAPDTIIAGGAYNLAADDYAFVGGGTRNFATGFASVVGGGAGNLSSNDQSTVVGGLVNKVDSKYGTVGGGYANIVSGSYATIPGGFENKVLGDFSFAAGRRAVVSTGHSGTFIFADASDMEFPSVAENEFAVRASGGVRFITSVNDDGEIISGVQLPAGSGSWATLSDHSAKTGFTSVNQQEILALVVNIPITTWRYLGQNESVQHIGPMSQDFYGAFGFGEDARYISMVDADGVSFAAIQGIFEIIQQQETLIKNQDDLLVEIETRLEKIERMSNSAQTSQPEIIHWLGWGLLVGFVGAFIGVRWQIYLSGLSSRKP